MADPGKSPESAFPLRVLSTKIDGWIGRLGDVWVLGQLTEVAHKRGWSYITLRDTQAEMSLQVSCPTSVFEASGPLAEGAEVVVHGKISWWTKLGRLTLQAQEFRPVGQGQLLAQLEQRKQLLRAEGLFDPQRKRQLPLVPVSIGLITGKDSAAEQDVVENVRRRWPAAHFVYAYAAMQGPHCVTEVIDAITRLDALPHVDVIVIARGGGSLDDLLPFYDEAMVRAVATAHTPIVSAIGHDVDAPLIDLAADWRASTPTDAAKRIVPDAAEERREVAASTARLRRAITDYLAREQHQLHATRSRPVLVNPATSISAHRDRLATQQERLQRAAQRAVQEHQEAITTSLARIRAMSPKATLERGYAILVHDGASVTSVNDVVPGQQLNAIVLDGELRLTVETATTHQREDSHD
ncbi:MAG: exodeoxyribonuclease VII large subunit [Propionibacteriaceae bacterium]